MRPIILFKSLVFTVRGTTCTNQWLTDTSNMGIEQSREEVKRFSCFGMGIPTPQDGWGFRSYSHTISILFCFVLPLSLGKRQAWNFRAKILEIIWPDPHLRVKNLGSEKVSVLPYWLVTEAELELRPWMFTQVLVPLIHSEPRNLALDKYLSGKDYALLRDLFPLIPLSLWESMSQRHSHQDKSCCCLKAFSLASYRDKGQGVNLQMEKKKPLSPNKQETGNVSQETGNVHVRVYVCVFRCVHTCIYTCMCMFLRVFVSMWMWERFKCTCVSELWMCVCVKVSFVNLYVFVFLHLGYCNRIP